MENDCIRGMLSSVRNSYAFFVDMTMGFIDQYGIGDEVANYIKLNKDVTASDVIKETHRLVYG